MPYIANSTLSCHDQNKLYQWLCARLATSLRMHWSNNCRNNCLAINHWYSSVDLQIAEIWIGSSSVFQIIASPSEADNFGGGPGTFLKIFFNFMFKNWDTRQEDWTFLTEFEHSPPHSPPQPHSPSWFMWPTWGPPGSCRPQMDPMSAPWTLLSGSVHQASRHLTTQSPSCDLWVQGGVSKTLMGS